MELMADIRPNKKPHAYTKGTEKVHIFFSFGTVALLLFSEAFRSLFRGRAPSLLLRFASCGVSSVSLSRRSRAMLHQTTQCIILLF